MDKTLTAVVVVACILSWVHDPARAETIRVFQDGTGDYTALPSGLNAAAEGDTILVGAGRYTETQDVVLGCCWPVTAYAPIMVPEITIIGSGRDVTIIGPAVPATDGPTTVGVGSLQRMPGLRIESLTIENLQFGVAAYGELDLWDLRIRNIEEAGVFRASTADTTLITACSFVNCDFLGIQLTNTSNAWVSECEFIGQSRSSMDLLGSENVHFLNSRSEDAWVALTSAQGSTLTVRDSYIRSGKDALGTHRSSLWVYDSHCEGVEAALLATGGGRVEFHRNQLIGDQITVYLSSTPDVQFSENDLVRNGQWAVWLDSIYDMNGEKLDFQHNWWGTTDVDSIQSWILDADNPIHDNDPREEGYVEFLPILEGSVPTRRQSVGGLKGRFREP